MSFEETSRIDLINISPAMLGSVHVGGASAVSSSRRVNKLRALSRHTHGSLWPVTLTDRQPKDEPQRPFCCIPPPLLFSISFCTYPLRATFSIPHMFHLLFNCVVPSFWTFFVLIFSSLLYPLAYVCCLQPCIISWSKRL